MNALINLYCKFRQEYPDTAGVIAMHLAKVYQAEGRDDLALLWARRARRAFGRYGVEAKARKRLILARRASEALDKMEDARRARARRCWQGEWSDEIGCWCARKVGPGKGMRGTDARDKMDKLYDKGEPVCFSAFYR